MGEASIATHRGLHCPILPFRQTKSRELKRLIPSQPSALLYVGHVDEHGESLFRLACREDLEGVVAKLKDGRYNPERRSSWIKIKNPAYTPRAGRLDLFQRKKAPGNLGLRRKIQTST